LVALLAAATPAVGAAPSSVRTAANGTERAGQIAAYRAAFPKLTEAEAARRVDGQPGRAALLRTLSTEYAATFGGSWYDVESGVQHLNLTLESEDGAVRRAAAKLGIAVATHVVRYSLDSLYRRAERIRDGQPTAPGLAATYDVGVDPVRNRVVVTASSGTIPAAFAATDPAVIVEPARAPKVVPDACRSRTNCDAPLRSGVSLGLWGISFCSVGFTARGDDGKRYAVMAGHCGLNGWTWSHHGVDIGRSGNSRNDGNVDVSMIQMSLAPWADASGGWMYNDADPNAPTSLNAAITALGQIQAGDTACLQGFHSDASHSCGIIESASDPDARGLTRVGFDGCVGDSGGGWYAPNNGLRTALGIHHGSADTCHVEGADSWFSPLPAINAYWDRTSATTIRVETR
jgi:streptogrisin C